MSIQRVSCTSQPVRTALLHLPRKQKGVLRSRARRRTVALLLLAASTALAANVGEPRHVTAVRFWSLGTVTRIAIQTDGDFQVKTDHLDNPDRIFYDLAGTKPALNHKALTVIPVSDRFVKQIRVAEPQPNITRVVLDLETPVEATTSRLENPDRLIIELRAPGGGPRAPGGKATESAKTPLRRPPVVAQSPPVVIPTTQVVSQTPATVIQTPSTPIQTPLASVQTSSAPPEPMPASKPVEHRPFMPPPTVLHSSAPARALQAAFDPPPEFAPRMAAVPAPVAIALNYKPALPPGPPSAGPPGATSSAMLTTALAKPALPAVTSSVPSTSASPLETALPAKRNSLGDSSMIRVLGLKVGRVVLDPGHGGHDAGTVGPQGLREKDLVLDVAQRLGRLIQEKMGSEVIYTRSDDTFVPLERRTEIANEAKADLFLSIHANSSPLRTAAGVETFYLNFTTSKSALELAARENAGSQMTVYELQDLLQKIALKDKVEESREFASRVQSALYALSARNTDARSKDRGVKKAPFVVLIGASMPSVLAEIGFISNAHDESIMRREDYRQRTAEALYKGLSGYASSLSHFQVAQRH
jgi:N-acetylmuramoyl-L-alanine amidase